jgi:two-component system cell cycle sensor histidine kinase/response regulator CckA
MATSPPPRELRTADILRQGDLRDVGERGFFELAEHAPVMIWVSNTAMQLEYVNRAWLEFNGLARVPREDVDWLQRVHPEDTEELLSITTGALERGIAYRVTARILNAEGDYRWILSEARPRHDAQGRMRGYIGCCTDLTDEKRARAELQEAEERLRLVMAGSSDAAWDWNLVTNDFYYSPRWWQMLGMEPGALPVDSNTWERVLHPEDRPRIVQLFIDAYEHGLDRFEMEFRQRHQDGHYVPMLCRGLVLRDSEKNPVRVSGVNTDLTERKRVDAERSRALDILQKVAARVPGVVYQYLVRPDDTACFPYASDAIRQIYRVTPEEVATTADPVMAILHPDDVPAVWASIQESRENLTPWIHEYRVRFADGTVHWLLGNAVPQREPDGSVLWHGFITDCTERKQSEFERETLEEQLREAQKMQAIGTLAGGIAHDFNNIAGAILGNVELARQDAAGSPELLRSLDQIQESAERARGLTRQILAFSRRQATNRQVFAVRPRIEAVRHLLRETLLAPVTLECHFESSAPDVLADPVQFDQALINLLTNAAQAMENRAGRIDIRVDAVDEPGSEATRDGEPHRLFTRIRITDEGHGMDAGTLKRVFEPFFTTKPVDQGTGLGLSVVYGILQAHGGRVTASSTPGVGSSFTLLFPAAAHQPSPSPPGETASVPSRAARILYIDDDRALLSMVQRLLERRGHRVSVAESAEQGLSLLRADPTAFDLLLIDYNMPVMKGTDVARASRALRADLPIALASGFITDALHAEARSLGISDVIFKADAVTEFCAVVDRLVRQPAPQTDSNGGGQLA